MENMSLGFIEVSGFVATTRTSVRLFCSRMLAEAWTLRVCFRLDASGVLQLSFNESKLAKPTVILLMI